MKSLKTARWHPRARGLHPGSFKFSIRQLDFTVEQRPPRSARFSLPSKRSRRLIADGSQPLNSPVLHLPFVALQAN
jgi:hypothetical protein